MQNFQFNILKDVTTNIFVIVFIFFIISIFLSFITTSLALRPVNLLAKEVKERGPHDLQEVKYPSPKELKPLLNSLNGFIKRLNTNFPNIPVNKFDERFTSKIAKQTILISGLNKKSRRNKQLVDKVSATIILQDYLSK